MNTHRLRHEIVPVEKIDVVLMESLFSLFQFHYDAVTRDRFEADLEEKDCIVLLRDTQNGEVKGFSTQQILTTEIDGKRVRALFSGDTIIDPAFWGEQELVRGWCRVAGKALAEEPETPLYWLLISKGFRTYLYLPVFYHEFWPQHDRKTPSEMRRLLDGFAMQKWPEFYDSASGLLRFPQSLGALKTHLADLPEGRQDDPHARFFLSRNPTFLQGTELVCLSEISIPNTKSIGKRLIQSAVREWTSVPEEVHV